ncbi:MAG: PAS domain S-box protein [Candidatus Marinimicrobia bacterium]|nr:PAS domain S-box protein [Candidatus Neomarinimicrobiota bacterium]
MMEQQKSEYKVLIIEDDYGLNRLIKRKLERQDIPCIQAHTGSEALNIIRNNSDKIILLMDYLLTDMNSIELILTLKDENISYPFIAMTGRGSEDIAVDLMKLGARDYMVKNEEFLDLLPNVVNQVLENILKDEQLKIAEDKIDFLGAITNQTSDIIFATDLNFNITYSNPAASNLYKFTEEEFLKMNIQEIITGDFLEHNREEMINIVFGEGFWQFEEEHRRKNMIEFHAHVKISPLFINNKLNSFIFIIRDITERKEREIEREKLIRELSDALGKIKTLEGLIPICANCKKIRSDDGYWEEVEVYIKNRSKADFTHGLCPSCTKQMYPEIYEKLKEQGKI